jgi:lipid A 3-O-deacylase
MRLKNRQLPGVLCFSLIFSMAVYGQASSGSRSDDRPAINALQGHTWEYGPFLQGGFGVGDRSSFHFLSAGIHGGKVLTDPWGPSLMKGQFEYDAELMPLWQAYTPAAHELEIPFSFDGQQGTALYPIGGGTFTGVSITPIILRWNLQAGARLAPWLQGAGGLVWTNHKFPPDVLVPHGESGGTSVFNFTPQFGVGIHYFVKPRRSIDLAANAIHISSASLGDRNPGVNASVQFQIGYSWWK